MKCLISNFEIDKRVQNKWEKGFGRFVGFIRFDRTQIF